MEEGRKAEEGRRRRGRGRRRRKGIEPRNRHRKEGGMRGEGSCGWRMKSESGKTV